MSADDSEAVATVTGQADQQPDTGAGDAVVEGVSEAVPEETWEETPEPAEHPDTETDTGADAGAGAAEESTRETVPAGFEPTGESAVDVVLERLNALSELGPAEHVGLYDEAHERLHQILTDVDTVDTVDAADADPDADGPAAHDPDHDSG